MVGLLLLWGVPCFVSFMAVTGLCCFLNVAMQYMQQKYVVDLITTVIT